MDVEKPSLHKPRTTAATVMLRMRHTLGDGAGLARSVVSDMLRKSLVMNSKTMSAGVKTAWPVMRPDRQEQNDLTLLDQHVERVGPQPLEGDPSFAYGKDDAGKPRLCHHHAAAAFATSVAVDTAIPICACRSAGASLVPSPHMPTTWPWLWP